MALNTMDLSVVMPVYNEAKRIRTAIESVLAQDFVAELIVVDDGSTDGTWDCICQVADTRVRPIRQTVNQGKGAALRIGFENATSPFVAVHDADLEYDPADLKQLLVPLRDGRADVVFGSRFMGSHEHRVLYYWHSVGNRILTTMSNMATNINLTDMETCSKVFKREVIQSLTLEEDRFGFEPEVTAKIAAGGYRIYEVGISYSGRTYAEGKKINWKDGMRAVYVIARYSPVLHPSRRNRKP
jgi:glycosyltransferase involved in cell wall biosynthesis